MKQKLFFLITLPLTLLSAQAMAQSSPAYPDVQINDTNGNLLPDTIVWNTQDFPVILTSTPNNIPVEYFNGTYTVEQIPYNPPDPTFYLNYPGYDTPTKKKLAISNDDNWAPSYINIDFPFYFFGIRKTKFLLGDNGIVTFATPSGYNGGGGCPYATTTPLPWPTSVPSQGGWQPIPDLMRDAIYGVYEDTYTGSNGAYMHGNQGIYYGVIDSPPCRKIIGSWNQIPVFNDSTKRESFQIVCYEGSNIIEIHVKRRNCCPSTNYNSGLIGIQNATGQPQQPSSDDDAPNSGVISGSPAAFFPTGYYDADSNFVSFNGGMFTTISMDSVAFRFTPQGNTNFTYYWERIFDDGRDPIILSLYDGPGAPSDTNGYYTPMDETNLNLTSAHIYLPGTYVFIFRFKNANGDWYTLSDTVTILDVEPHQVIVLSSDNTMGTVTGGGTYTDNSVAQLCAYTQQGYTFRGWDNGAGDNPYSVTVTSDTTLTALFFLPDTVYRTDTVYVYDTIYVGVDEVDMVNAKIFIQNGEIVVDGATDNEVYLYDINGKLMATKRDSFQLVKFGVPTSGTYLVKIGNHPARRVVVIK